MKKYLLLLMAMLFAIGSYSQNVKSIRVNNSTQMYNQSISISDIDSITYDTNTQSQIIHTKNGIETCPLSEVDSLSFSNDEAINALFTQDYIEDATTCLFSNGWALSVSTDSLTNYMITIDSYDFVSNSWDSSKSVAVYCDSLHRPILAQNEYYTYYFSNYDGDSFDLKVVKPDGEEVIVEGVSISNPQKARRRVNWTQEINSTSDEINGALFMYDNIDAIYNPTPTGIGTTIASWINNLFVPSGTSQDAISWGISAIAALFAPGAVAYSELTLSTKQLILSKAREEAEKRIGKCTAHISKVSRKDGNTAVVNFEISDVSSSSLEQACYQINYWAIVNGQRTNVVHSTNWAYAENGSKSIEIPNLSGGKYGFQLIIFPRSLVGHHNLINLFKIPSNVAYLDMEPIYIEEIKQDYTTYADDKVTVSMKVKLKYMSEQDQTILSYYDSYGVYYHYDDHVNQREDYISVKENGSNEFYITFDIPREDFSCDYNNFVATCANKITFKTYTIDGWGIKEFYDEQEPKIIYNQKPSLTFTSASMGSVSTQTYQDDEGNEYLHYSVPYWFDFNVEGAFWIDHVQYTIYGDGWTYNGGNPIIVYDGPYSYESSMGYYQGSDLSTVDFYTITLTNGSTMRSSNSMIFGGADANPTISVGGAPNFTRQRRSISVKSLNSTGKRMNTKTGIGIVNKR